MAGIFLSYSRADRELAQQVLRELRAIGVEVWWDEDMPGVNWQDELERQATALSALVVIWTPSSRNSAYVKDEARLALSHDKLVNVLCGVSAPPFPFDRVNGLPIDDWDGRHPHTRWRLLVETIDSHLADQGAIRPGELTRALARREDRMRHAQDSLEAAQQAFAGAKAGQEEAIEGKRLAREALDTAEERFRRIVEMKAGPVIVRAAQAEVDEFRVALDAADKARLAAGAQLAVASQALTRARGELEGLFAGTPGADAADSGTDAMKEVDGAPPTPPRSPPRPVVSEADAPALPATPASAQPPTAAEAPPSRPRRGAPLLIGGGVVAIAAVIAALALHPVGPNTSAAPPAASVGSPAANVAPLAPAAVAVQAPAVPDPADQLVGTWSIGSAECGSPVVFAKTSAGLTRTFAGATVDVETEPSPAADVLAFRADGARYQLRDGALFMTPAGSNKPVELISCAG